MSEVLTGSLLIDLENRRDRSWDVLPTHTSVVAEFKVTEKAIDALTGRLIDVFHGIDQFSANYNPHFAEYVDGRMPGAEGENGKPIVVRKLLSPALMMMHLHAVRAVEEYVWFTPQSQLYDQYSSTVKAFSVGGKRLESPIPINNVKLAISESGSTIWENAHIFELGLPK